MTHQRLLPALLIVLAALSAAAGSAPAATEDPVKAKVYVIYDKWLTGGIGILPKMSVRVDEKQLGKLGKNQYMVVELPAGRHTIRGLDAESAMGIELEAGKEYFIRMELTAAKGKFRAVLLELDPQRGKSALAGAKQVSGK